MRVSSKSLHMLIQSLMPGHSFVNYLFACCPACLTTFCLHPKPDQVEGDLLLGDMGQGLPLRTGCFDGAISISALQWLCNADRAGHEPRARLRAFFTSLYRALTRGSRAVLQVGRMVLLRMGFLLCARLVRCFISLEAPPSPCLVALLGGFAGGDAALNLPSNGRCQLLLDVHHVHWCHINVLRPAVPCWCCADIPRKCSAGRDDGLSCNEGEEKFLCCCCKLCPSLCQLGSEEAIPQLSIRSMKLATWVSMRLEQEVTVLSRQRKLS